MIIFMDNPKYIEAIKDKFVGRPTIILNLSSLYSGYTDISNLITKIAPINNSGLPIPEFVNSYMFDMQYASCIFNDPILYPSFMDIMIRAYEGYIVCILVQRDPYRDAIMESLIKLIQQRYQYNCWIIEDESDIDVLSEKMMYPAGLLQLDADINQYNKMCSKGLVHQILNPNNNIE